MVGPDAIQVEDAETNQHLLALSNRYGPEWSQLHERSSTRLSKMDLAVDAAGMLPAPAADMPPPSGG